MSLLADRAVDLVAYLQVGDATADGLLESLVRGLLDPADRLSLVAHGDGALLGPWAALTDPELAPLWALPHAAQWTGGTLPARLPTETDDQYLARARAEVIAPSGMRRGSDRALVAVAQQYLTGTRMVSVVQRYEDDVWRVALLVYEAETPDLAALTAAVTADRVVTAGMEVTVAYRDPATVWTVAELESTYFGRTLADLEADFATVLDLENREPI